MNTQSPVTAVKRKRHSRTDTRKLDDFLHAINLLCGGKPRPRNGKIARLPEPTRNLINQIVAFLALSVNFSQMVSG